MKKVEVKTVRYMLMEVEKAERSRRRELEPVLAAQFFPDLMTIGCARLMYGNKCRETDRQCNLSH